MQSYPHRYDVHATARSDGNVTVSSEGLPPLQTAPPPQFDGPGDLWSPETMLVAAAAGCFVLTFRAIANASKLPWQSLGCDAEGVLDRSEGVARFTELRLRAVLVLAPGADAERAERLLEKASKTCLITNSLAVSSALAVEIVRAGHQHADA